MIEINWGTPLTYVVSQDGDTKKFTTIEQARYWLRKKWPVADHHRPARRDLADRPVHQGSGDGRVDPTGESTGCGPLTYRGLNPLHRLLYEGARRPGRATLTNPEEKIRDDLLTAGCMCHFGVELNPEDGTLHMPERSYR